MAEPASVHGLTDILPRSVGAATLDNMPYGALSFAADQAIPGITYTNVAWDQPAAINTGGGMKYTSSGLIVPRNGFYLVTASVYWSTSGTGTRFNSRSLGLLVNTTQRNLGLQQVFNVPAGGGGSAPTQTLTIGIAVTAGTTLGAWVYNDVGTLNLGGTTNFPDSNQLVVVFISNYG